MDERVQAREIANQWLNMRMNPLTQMVPGDPDCDAVVLARQYMRALEKIEKLRQFLHQATDHTWHTSEITKHLADVWPSAVQP